MLNKIIKNTLWIFLTFSFQAIAEVTVSRNMAAEPFNQSLVVNPSSYTVLKLPGTGNANDSYKIGIRANNAIYKDITAFIVDDQNLNLFKQGYQFRGIGYQKAVTPFYIQGSTFTVGNHYLVLDNRYAALISKKIDISIESKFQLSDDDAQKIKDIFVNFYSNLKEQINYPDFNINVDTCGEANASSNAQNGDIKYCAEMIYKLTKSRNSGALAGIFLHEVGHSVLRLWEMPGNNNEDIADEFATYMMMSSGPKGQAFLQGYLDFWAEMIPLSQAEARNMIVNGDRHSLSIQRIRNIRENIIAGEAFMKKWNRLLYPHFTNQGLQKIIDNPQRGEDPELAKATLSQMVGFQTQ